MGIYPLSCRRKPGENRAAVSCSIKNRDMVIDMDNANLKYFHDRIHSDLFLETAAFQTDRSGWPDIRTKEYIKNGAEVTELTIETEEQAVFFGKEKGRYITLYAEYLRQNDGGTHREISMLVEEMVRKLIPEESKQIFLVGLGNAEASPDALGPDVVRQVHVNRHIEAFKEPENYEKTDHIKTGCIKAGCIKADHKKSICALVPGVMAQTGLETADILRAIVDRIQPDAMIVVDALAAGSVTRLGTTIQITDTGIAPGSGIGNHRQALNRESLGIPVIAIGIPMVVEAAAIIYETIDAIRNAMKEENMEKTIENCKENEFLGMLSKEEQYQLFRELLEEKAEPLYVTVKDIDELEKRLAFTLSEAINYFSENV